MLSPRPVWLALVTACHCTVLFSMNVWIAPTTAVQALEGEVPVPEAPPLICGPRGTVHGVSPSALVQGFKQGLSAWPLEHCPAQAQATVESEA